MSDKDEIQEEDEPEEVKEEEEDDSPPQTESETEEVDEKSGEAIEISPPATTEVESADKPASNELKIVIIMKANRAMIGVQAPDCDPVYETMDGDLPAVLAWVPKTVEVARLKWAVSKRNPKADLPKPPAPAKSTTVSAPAGKKTAKAAAAPQAQPKFF